MAKQQSLAAQTGALSEGLKMHSVFSAPQQPILARKIAPYVTFAHPRRTDEWAALVAKYGDRVQEGGMFLVEPERSTPLPVAKVCYVAGRQYWAETNPAGEVIRTSWKEMPHPYKEHIEAVVLVLLEDRVVPANIQFRTTKCPAAKILSDTLAEAATQEWADRSPQHKETLICNQPFMRFYGNIALGPQRTSRTSGLVYRSTTCSVQPTGAAEWRLLKQFVEHEGTQAAMDAAAERFEWRIGEVIRKLAA